MEDESKQEPVVDNGPKKSYQSPALTRYGKIASLTQGGSGLMQEMAGMMAVMGDQQLDRFP